MEQTLAGLGSRVFLLNNVHEDDLWSLPRAGRCHTCVARSPASKSASHGAAQAAARTAAPATMPAQGIAATTTFASTVTANRCRSGGGCACRWGSAHIIAGCVPFLHPARGSRKDRTSSALLARRGRGISSTQSGCGSIGDIVAITPLPMPDSRGLGTGGTIELAVTDLEKAGEPDAHYGALPSAAGQAKSYTVWNRDFAAWVYGTQKLELLRSPGFKLIAAPDESERDFHLRIQQMAREQRDEAVEALRKKYAPKLTTLQERLRKAEQAVEREQAQVRQAGLQTAVNVGSTLLGALLGRKVVSSSTVGKAATAAKSAGRASQQREDVARAEETVQVLQKQLADLQADFDAETQTLAAKMEQLATEVDHVAVKPRKTDISVQLVSLVWMPHWQDEGGGLLAAW